jgi:hypothetical protein
MTTQPLRGAFLGDCDGIDSKQWSVDVVTMIGLINANLMTWPQSIGVMLGQGDRHDAHRAARGLLKLGISIDFHCRGRYLIEFMSHRDWQGLW